MSYLLATAYVDVEARMNKLDAGFNRVQDRLGGMMMNISSLAGSFGIGLTIGAAVAATRGFIRAAEEAYDSESRLRGVIKATGAAAGFAAEDVMKLAMSIQSTTIYGDEMVMDAASKLLTFKKVQGDTFTRALKLATDLAGTGFGSVSMGALQLGKSLEDPIRGIGALRRAGVSFTDAEKAKIKTLVETNRLLEAQTMILDAVAGQVGGVAEAIANTPAGQWKQINNLIGDVGEELGKRILPVALSLAKIFYSIASGVMKMWDAAIRLGVAIRDKVWEALQPIIQWFSGVTGLDMSWLEDGFTAAITNMIDAWYEFATDTYEWVQVFIENAGTGFQFLKDGFTFVVQYMFDLIRNNAMYVWGYFWGRATRAGMDFVVWLTGALIDAAVAMGEALVNIIFKIPEWIAAALSGAEAQFESFADTLAANIQAGVEEAMYQGMRGMDGLIDGFEKKDMDLKLGMGAGTKKSFDAMNDAFATLLDAKNKLEATRGDMWKLPGDDVKRALDAAVPDEAKKVEVEFSTGLMGLTQAWTDVQNKMLEREKDPQKEMAEGIKGIEKVNEDMLDEMVKLNTDGVKLQNVAVA